MIQRVIISSFIHHFNPFIFESLDHNFQVIHSFIQASLPSFHSSSNRFNYSFFITVIYHFGVTYASFQSLMPHFSQIFLILVIRSSLKSFFSFISSFNQTESNIISSLYRSLFIHLFHYLICSSFHSFIVSFVHHFIHSSFQWIIDRLFHWFIISFICSHFINFFFLYSIHLCIHFHIHPYLFIFSSFHAWLHLFYKCIHHIVICVFVSLLIQSSFYLFNHDFIQSSCDSLFDQSIVSSNAYVSIFPHSLVILIMVFYLLFLVLIPFRWTWWSRRWSPTL